MSLHLHARARRAALVVSFALLALAACGSDDDTAGGDDAGGAGDAAGYCALSAELDAAGEAVFAALESDDTATDEDYARVEREFFDSHSDDFARLQSIAPAEIRDDVGMVLAGIERLAQGELPSEEQQAAEGRVLEFEAQNCS